MKFRIIVRGDDSIGVQRAVCLNIWKDIYYTWNTKDGTGSLYTNNFDSIEAAETFLKKEIEIINNDSKREKIKKIVKVFDTNCQQQ